MTALEHASFAPERQEGKTSIKRSILSPHQEVWVLRATAAADTAGITVGTAGDSTTSGGGIRAAMVLRLNTHTLRIYSIAVCQSCRGLGLGQQLLDHALARAKKLGKTTVSLEADAANPRLLSWYGSRGFTPVKRLADYYGKGQDGIRLRRQAVAPHATR